MLGRFLKYGSSHSKFEFDIIIIATHANQALEILHNPSDAEIDALSSWHYSRNQIILHSDESIMPPNKRAWASWNSISDNSVREDSRAAVCVTYWMNKLQNIKSKTNYFVTLNPAQNISPAKIIFETEFSHPQYSVESMRSQALIKRLNEQAARYICGSYCGYGFHEDGVVAALSVVNKLLEKR